MSAGWALRDVRWTTPDEPVGSEILAGVNLEIGVGESVGMVGPSGAGKTTLATILAGLLEPWAGEVEMGGSVGLVFQEPERGFFEESVLEDVAFGPANAGASTDAAHDLARRALERVGLDPERIGSRTPETLSGGEARRAAIAGVIAFEPALVMFDEPTTGLDADGVERFREVLAALRDTGTAFLLVSHDVGLIAEECARLVVLDRGRITWDGSPSSLPEGLPDGWRREPAQWGGELAVLAAAMRERGWIGDDAPLDPESLAEAFAQRAG